MLSAKSCRTERWCMLGRTPHFLYLRRLMMLVLSLRAISAHDIPAISLKSSLCLSGPARPDQQQRCRQGHQPLGTWEPDSRMR